MYIKRIRELREDNDLKQKEVAAYLKITQQQYSLYENGKRTLPVDLLIKLSKLYKVSTDYILEVNVEERTTTKNQINISGDNFGKITMK